MRIAIVTNILTPYRKSFYKELSTQLKEEIGELKVFVLTDSLPLRPWTFENLKEDFTELVPGKKVFIKNEDYLFNIRINGYLKKFRPDIVIIAGSWTYPTLWHILLHKDKGVKYFFWTESHNNRATKVGTSNPFILKVKRDFYNHFDGYCIPGKYANETVTYLIGEKGIRVKLPNLVDNEFYSKARELRKRKVNLREKYSLSLDKIIFVCPARLIKIKGIDLFLKYASYSPNIEKVSFVIAGEGPEKDNIQKVSEKYGIDVKLMGYCSQEVVRELYALADAFWLPSLQDANPLTSIEAAFAGLPLFVSKYTGNSPELVKDGKNGILFDTINRDSVVNAIDFITTIGSEWIQTSGELSYGIASDSFESKKEVTKFVNSFKNIIRE